MIEAPPATRGGRLRRLILAGDAAFGRAVDHRPSNPLVASLLPIGLAVAGMVIAFLRIPERSVGLLWAEDAGVFLEAAYRVPLGEALSTGYAGYAHLVPRLVAAATASWVPIDHVPIATSIVMAALTSALALAVFHLSRSHLTTLGARLMVWALVIAAPVAGLEIALSAANFQWYLLLGAFWAVFGRRPDIVGTIVSSALLALAIGSSAIALLFLPFALWRAVRFRTIHDVAPPVVALVASAYQLLVIVTSERDRGGRSLNPFSLLGNYVVEVIGGGWVGPQLVYWTYAVVPVVVVIVGLGLALLTYRWVWRMRDSTPLGVLALAFGWIYLIPVMWLTATAGPYFAGWFNPGATGSRYAFLPIALAGVALVAVIDDRLARPRPLAPASRLLVAVLVASQVIAIGVGYRAADPRHAFLGGLPAWEVALEEAREECADDPSGVAYLRGSADSEHEWDSLGLDCAIILGAPAER